MKIVIMGIELPALSQNGPTKLVVRSFGGQSTIPSLLSSLINDITQFSVLYTQIPYLLILDVLSRFSDISDISRHVQVDNMYVDLYRDDHINLLCLLFLTLRKNRIVK